MKTNIKTTQDKGKLKMDIWTGWKQKDRACDLS